MKRLKNYQGYIRIRTCSLCIRWKCFIICCLHYTDIRFVVQLTGKNFNVTLNLETSKLETKLMVKKFTRILLRFILYGHWLNSVCDRGKCSAEKLPHFFEPWIFGCFSLTYFPYFDKTAYFAFEYSIILFWKNQF